TGRLTARVARNAGPFSWRFPFGFPVESQTSELWSQLTRTRETQNGAGDANHERISVPEVSQSSQQRLTSIGHYESAWRTVNTGSNPVGPPRRKSPVVATERCERASWFQLRAPRRCRRGPAPRGRRGRSLAAK